VLPLPRARCRAAAGAAVPPLLRDGHRDVPARPSPLPARHHRRRRGGGRRAARRVIQVTTPAEARLLALVGDAVRGPKRNGLFALWLVLRAAEALLPPGAVSAKNHRRRLQALETRLASLALPAPLKRALTAARHHLEAATPGAAALEGRGWPGDRKSTRLNSSHVSISYAVFC